VTRVGNGVKNLSELVREYLSELDFTGEKPAPAPAAVATPAPAPTELEVVENDEKDGFELYFPGKPDDDLNGQLRAAGFRPSKKRDSDLVGQWYWWAKRTPERRAFVEALQPDQQTGKTDQQTGKTSDPVAAPVPVTPEALREFMRSTQEPVERRAENRDGRLIGGVFDYQGHQFEIEPVNDVQKGYATIGYRLKIGADYKRPLRYFDDSKPDYFQSVREARLAAFVFISGAKPWQLSKDMFQAIFRTHSRVAWILEQTGGTTFRNQFCDRDLTGWRHEEISELGHKLICEWAHEQREVLPPVVLQEHKKFDPKLQKRVGQFRDMADRLQATIDGKLAPRLENTRKRIEEAQSQRQDAYRLQKVQAILRGLADQIEAQTIEHPLTEISSKKQIEDLIGWVERFEMTSEEAMNRSAFNQGWTVEEIIRTYGATEADIHQGCADLAKKMKLSPDDMVKLVRALKEIANGGTQIDHKTDRLRVLTAMALTKRIPGYVPTPRPLGEELIGYLDIEPGDIVADPSGGSGALLEVIRDRHPDANLVTLEYNDELRELLELKGFEVLGKDCLEWKPTGDKRPKKIAVNPPFEGMADVDHVMTLFDDVLAPGGTLAAIMSAAPFFQSAIKAKRFRAWLEGSDEFDNPPTCLYQKKNAPDAFKPSGTGVQTHIVVLKKPQATVKPQPVEEPPAEPIRLLHIRRAPQPRPVAGQQLSLF
jgi:hypothetical protein